MAEEIILCDDCENVAEFFIDNGKTAYDDVYCRDCLYKNNLTNRAEKLDID